MTRLGYTVSFFRIQGRGCGLKKVHDPVGEDSRCGIALRAFFYLGGKTRRVLRQDKEALIRLFCKRKQGTFRERFFVLKKIILKTKKMKKYHFKR